MGNLRPEESTDNELTDEQCFRQMVESFVEMRSENEKRKFPRFPTPAALSGKLGIYGFEGILVCEADDSSGDANGSPEEIKGLGGVESRIRKINIVDFSEDGVQLRLNSNDLLSLQGRSLFLEVQNFRLPVRFRWCMHSGFEGEGGFSFDGRIDSDQYLARFISTLNTKLIEFLLNEYKEYPTTFSKQGGIFIYFAIYYGLRLKFLEIVAEINHLTSTAEAEYPSAVQEVMRQTFQEFHYSSFYHREQISRNISDPRLKRLLHIYMKPYYAFGCGIPGMRQSSVFLRDDAWATILNSVFFAKLDCRPSTKILPSLLYLHHSFLRLKQFIPGVFEAEEMDEQFRYYSSIIFEMELLRERVVDYLSSQRETETSLPEKDYGSETTGGEVPLEALPVPGEGTSGFTKRMPNLFLVMALVVVVAATAFFCGLWFGRTTGFGVKAPHVQKSAVPQAESSAKPLHEAAPPAATASSPGQEQQASESGKVKTGDSTPLPVKHEETTPVEGLPGAEKAEQTPETSPQPQMHLFEIEAEQEAWVQVKIDNKTTHSALLKPGEKREWEAEQNMQILLGNAGGVRMKWDGIALRPVGKQGEPVRFQLPDPKYLTESKSSRR